MTRFASAWFCRLAMLICAGSAAAQPLDPPLRAQEGGRSASGYAAPRNSMGQPDLSGLWTNATLTTLERPPEYGERLVMTDAEVAKAEGVAAAALAEADSSLLDPGSHVMNVNGERRASFLVEPRNGRLPAFTAEAAAARSARLASIPRGPGLARGDNPEAMTLAERCLKDFGSSSGPPMMPLLYNNTYQIVQSPDHVVILIEMVHDARIIPLTRTRKRPGAIRQWMGDSIGWYEGDDLVIETTGFRPGQAFRGGPENLKLVERLRRVNDRQILYSFEIDDPAIFTAPIRAEIAMNAMQGRLYEYACHEGNYAMANILGAARRAEAGQ